MAIIASKGPDDAAEDPVLSSFRAVRSVVEDPSRSPAPREEDVVPWIWEAEKSLIISPLSMPREGMDVLGASNRELPRPGNGLHDYIRFLNARSEEFRFCACQQGLDYCCVRSVLSGLEGDIGKGADLCSSEHGRCQCVELSHHVAELLRDL